MLKALEQTLGGQQSYKMLLLYFAMYYAHSCITRTQFLGVKSGEKSHVPIHNTWQIWTTDRSCTKLSIVSSYKPSSPISITHRSIRHWHLINDELKRKRKLKRKEKKKKERKKNRLLGIRQGAVFFKYLFMVL